MPGFLERIPYGSPRQKRVGFTLLSLVVLYVLAGFLLVPAVVKPIAQDELTSVLNGRTVTVKDISFNPLLLQVELNNVTIAKKDGKGSLFEVDSIGAALSISSLYRFAPVISFLHVDNPKVELAFMGNGVYSVSDLLRGQGAEPEKQKDADKDGPDRLEETTLFPLVIHEFSLSGGSIELDDRERGMQHVISDLNVTVPFTSTLQPHWDDPIEPVLECSFNGDPVRLKGTTKPFGETLRTEFHLGVVDVDMDRYWSYVPFTTSVKLSNGLFSSDLRLLVQRPENEPMQLILEGDGSFRDVDLTGPDGNTVFGLKSVSFELGQVRPLEQLVSVQSISVDAPRLKLVRLADGSLDLLNYLAPEAAATAASGADSPPPASTTDDDGSPVAPDVQGLQPRKDSAQDVDHPGDQMQDGTKKENSEETEPQSAPAGQPESSAIDGTGSGSRLSGRSLFGVSEAYAQDSSAADEGAPEPRETASASSAGSGDAAPAWKAEDVDAASDADGARADAPAPGTQDGKPAGTAQQDTDADKGASGKTGATEANAPPAPDPDAGAGTGASPAQPADANGPQEESQDGSSDVASASAGAPGFRLEIARAELKAGELDWTDHAVEGGFSRVYGPLNIKASALEDDRSKVGLTLSLAAGDAERLTAQGTLSLRTFALQGQCALENLHVPVYEPYFADYLPVDIRKGTVSSSTTIAFGPEGLRIGSTDVTLQDVDVRAAKDRVGFTAGRIALTGGELNMTEGTMDVRGLQITKPHVRLDLDENLQPPQLVIDDADGDMADPDGEQVRASSDPLPDDEPSADGAGPDTASPLLVRLETLGVEQAGLLLTGGRSGGTLLDLDGVRLQAENLSTAKDAKARVSGTVPFSMGGSLSLKGEVQPMVPAVSMQLDSSKVALTSFNGLLRQFANLRLEHGEADMDMQLDFALDDSVALDLKGDAVLSGVQAALPDDKHELASVQKVSVHGLDMSSSSGTLSINNVEVLSPSGRYVRNAQGKTNFERIALDPAGDTAAAEPEPAPRKGSGESGQKSLLERISIGEATVRKGHFLVNDQTLDPPFLLKAEHMEMDVTRRGELGGQSVRLDGTVGGGSVKADGVMHLRPEEVSFEGKAHVQGMDLLPFSPFAVREVGYPVLRGKFNADVDLKLDGSHIDADNAFLLRQFELGDPVPGAKKPKGSVKFGLSLLRDSSGDISLNIPVSGELGDPNLMLGGIIFKALSNVLVGALTSPFSLLGSIVGSLHSEELEYVAFEPGSIRLTDQSRKKLQDIAEALNKRPRILVDIDGVADTSTDAEGVREFLFMQELRDLKYATLPIEQQRQLAPWQVKIDDEYEELLQEVFTRETGKGRKTREIMERELKERIEVTDNAVENLAMIRARVVERYLLSLDPQLKDRLFVIQRVDNVNNTGKSGKLPNARVDLSLR